MRLLIYVPFLLLIIFAAFVVILAGTVPNYERIGEYLFALAFIYMLIGALVAFTVEQALRLAKDWRQEKE